METLYISQENCKIHREGEHLRITQSDTMLSTIPLSDVKTIIIFDSINLTFPALDLLLSKGIDVIYQSKSGKIKARVLSSKASGATVRLAQYAAFNCLDRRLEIAKAIVSAKIHNQMSNVRKFQYNNTLHDYDGHLTAINGFRKQLNGADNISEVMGIEGVSAKYYWDCFRHSLKKPVFTRREYRPSPDYVNALLNLSYSFLCNEITTCLIAKRLDIEIGFLHSMHNGRNSLALDVMEEFRTPCVDGWVRSVLNKNQLKSEHFYNQNNDWRLTDNGFRKFCTLYHDRIPLWRTKFRNQASKLKTALVEGVAYEPYYE